jgi:hypothetical protein
MDVAFGNSRLLKSVARVLWHITVWHSCELSPVQKK